MFKILVFLNCTAGETKLYKSKKGKERIEIQEGQSDQPKLMPMCRGKLIYKLYRKVERSSSLRRQLILRSQLSESCE